MAAIFDSPVTPMSECIRTSPSVLLDPKHVGGGVAIGISLLSCTQAEIYTTACVLPFYDSQV